MYRVQCTTSKGSNAREKGQKELIRGVPFSGSTIFVVLNFVEVLEFGTFGIVFTDTDTTSFIYILLSIRIFYYFTTQL